MDGCKILVIDDEPLVRFSIKEGLLAEGFNVSTASQAQEGLDFLGDEHFDIVITDQRMPGLSGLDLLKKIREMDYPTEVILITAYGTIESAVEAMKMGAFDYITKPFEMDELIILIRRIQEFKRLERENIVLREELKSSRENHEIIGKSEPVMEVMNLIRTVAPTNSAVLIEGESGVGKELVAREIHQLSNRQDKPFIIVSCPALSETLLETEFFGHEKGAFTGAHRQRKGRFELAHTGTIFLDEIGEIPLSLQAKLLRVLQEKEFERVGGDHTIKTDVRVICATKKNLLKEVENGRYREDLFYRLKVFPIMVPPLRNRKEDIPLLLESFTNNISNELGKDIDTVSAPAVRSLLEYNFPGNIRELKNIIERAVILCNGKEILKEHLPLEVLVTGTGSASRSKNFNAERTLAEVLGEYEKECLQNTLQAFDGNKGNAAKALGISRKNLWEKIKKYQL